MDERLANLIISLSHNITEMCFNFCRENISCIEETRFIINLITSSYYSSMFSVLTYVSLNLPTEESEKVKDIILETEIFLMQTCNYLKIKTPGETCQ